MTLEDERNDRQANKRMRDIQDGRRGEIDIDISKLVLLHQKLINDNQSFVSQEFHNESKKLHAPAMVIVGGGTSKSDDEKEVDVKNNVQYDVDGHNSILQNEASYCNKMKRGITTNHSKS